MASFNYTDIHLFDKSGAQLPMIYDSNVLVRIPSVHGDDAVFYGVTSGDGSITYHCKKYGTRFDMEPTTDDGDRTATLPGFLVVGDSSVGSDFKVSVEAATAADDETEVTTYTITGIQESSQAVDMEKAGFPSTTFMTSVDFNHISTDLVETQSIYLLAEKDGEYVKLGESEDAASWGNKYRILFYIDTNEQTNFRLFSLDNDEVVWSNKQIIDINEEGDAAYRVNIGFTATEEGAYENMLYVCLIDAENEIYPIGAIKLFAEAIGEDERYRTLFTNFGIPDPIEYQDVFMNTDTMEGKDDMDLLNKNSKKMFLAYSEIFPYVGTYKALINAVKVLGYEDVFFKEWYKELGKTTTNSNYVSYDISYKADRNANLISNLTIDERISLRKLNWLSMIYKINEELESEGIDKYGFPTVKTVYGYNNADIVVKLIALKKWLEKYIIGLNCRIIDIGGEGIYYERYRLNSYATYQQLIDWNNEFNIAPYVIEETNGSILVDSSAFITIDVGVGKDRPTIEDYANYRFIDLCDGYIDEVDCFYAIKEDSVITEDVTYVGGTFDMPHELEAYQIKAKSTVKDFVFGPEFLCDTEDAPYAPSSRILVSDNEIFLNPYDIYRGNEKGGAFKVLPVIQLERANFRKMSASWKNSTVYSVAPEMRPGTAVSYVFKDLVSKEKQGSVDYVTLIPSKYVNNGDGTVTLTTIRGDSVDIDISETPDVIGSGTEPILPITQYKLTYGLRYSSDNPYNMPMFSVIGYQLETDGINLPVDEELYLEILDGKMIFDDEENDRQICLNFNYDDNTGKQEVEINILYTSEEFNVTTYTDGDIEFAHFTDGGTCGNFAKVYREDADAAVLRSTLHEIKVENSGSFLVDVIGRDIHNNIFAANCDNKAIVLAPMIEALAHTNDPMPYPETSVDASLADSYVPFALYKPNYFIKGINCSVDASTKSIGVYYPTYSYSMHNPEPGDFVHMMSITDMYKVDAIDSIIHSTNIEIGGKPAFEGCSLVMSKNGYKTSRVIEGRDTVAMNLMYEGGKDIFDSSDGSIGTVNSYLEVFSKAESNYADVNVVLFNELGGFPVLQTYGTMINDKPFGEGYHGNYRLLIDEDSASSYIWASLRNNVIESTRLVLAEHMAERISANGADASVYNDTDYVVGNLAAIMMQELIDSSTSDSHKVNAGSNSLDYVKTLLNASSLIDASSATDIMSSNFIIPYLGTDHTYSLSRDVCSLFIDSSVLFAVYSNVEHIFGSEDASVQDFADDIREFFTHEITVDGSTLSIASLTDAYHVFDANVKSFSTDINTDILLSGSATVAATLLHNPAASVSDLPVIARMLLKEYTKEFDAKDLESFNSVALGPDKTNIVTYLCDENTFAGIDGSTYLNVDDESVMEAIIAPTLYYAEKLNSLIETTAEDEMARIWNQIRFATYVYITVWFMKEIYSGYKSFVDSSTGGNTKNVPSVDSIFDKFEIATDSSICEATIGYSTSIAQAMHDFWFALDSSAANGAHCLTTDMTVFGKDEYGMIIDENMPTGQVNPYKKYIYVMENLVFNAESGIRGSWVTKGDVRFEADEDTALFALAGREYESDDAENITEDTDFRPAEKEPAEDGRDDGVIHYLKTDSNFNGGLSYVGQDKSDNMLPSIVDMLNTNYISLYIKPTWMSKVYVYLINQDSSLGPDSSTDSSMGIDSSIHLDPNYDYLYVTYTTNGISTSFKPGEKVKLIFESADTNKYIGQSTYEVVGYDLMQNNIIIRGKINSRYLTDHESGMWSEMTDWTLDDDGRMVKEPTVTRNYREDETGKKTYLNSWTYTNNGKTVTLTKASTYITVRVPGNNTNQIIPIRLVRNPDVYSEKEADSYIWYYKLYGKIAPMPQDRNTYTNIFPINSTEKTSERVNMYISYAHHSYVDYTTRALGSTEHSNGMTSISLEYNRENRTYMDFVDDTFSVLSTKFDINEGQYAWMDGKRNSIDIEDVSPALFKSPIYTSAIKDIVLKDKMQIAFSVDTDIEDPIIRWNVYKLDRASGERGLKFECFNPVLFLDYDEKGLYDIEATLYDKYGNASTHMYRGAYKIE